jgi:hypothetical protein
VSDHPISRRTTLCLQVTYALGAIGRPNSFETEIHGIQVDPDGRYRLPARQRTT